MAVADPETQLKSALNLPGTKLSPDLEQIIRDPAMVKAIRRAAKNEKIGWNPFLKYSSEQLRHVFWHFDEWLWGPSKPFLWRKTEYHPDSKYRSPMAFLKDSKNYLLTLGVDIPYNIRSFFTGVDGGKLQKSKTFIAAARELPHYMRDVITKVVSDAKEMKAADRERTYLRDLDRTTINPHALRRTRQEVQPYVRSFDDIVVNGLDEPNSEGLSTADLLKKGKVLVQQNHPSLIQIATDYEVFGKRGINNVITVAGINLISMMKDRREARRLKILLQNSGALFIERNFEGNQSEYYMYNLGTEKLVCNKLDMGFNIVMYSNGGREKLTNEPDPNTSILRSAGRYADYILTIAQGYERVPDARELATVSKNTPPASFEYLAYMGAKKNGKLYVVCGKPHSIDYYYGLIMAEAVTDEAKEKLEKLTPEDLDLRMKQKIRDITEIELKQLMPFTKTYVFANAIVQLLQPLPKHSKAYVVQTGAVFEKARKIVRYGIQNGFYVPRDMREDSSLRHELFGAIDILVEDGAMSRFGLDSLTINEAQKPIADFYGSKIAPSLALPAKQPV
jgi:hypothetical protein